MDDKMKQPAQDYGLLLDAVRYFPDCIFVKNAERRYVAASDSFCRMLGFSSAEEVVGRRDEDLLSDAFLLKRYRRADDEVLLENRDLLDRMECLTDAAGATRYRSTCKYCIRDENGTPIGLTGRVRDVTREIVAREYFTQELQKFRQMDENDCYIAVIDLNDWKLLMRRTNPAYGEPPRSAMELDAVMIDPMILAAANADDAYRFYSNFSFEYINALFRQGTSFLKFEYVHDLWNGQSQWMRDVISLRINPENGHLMVLLRIQSISGKKKRELELQRAAEMDGLTGLLNRSFAREKITELLDRSGDRRFSFYVIDVDSFKTVNDTYGHQVGDKLLVQVAAAIRKSFRKEDIVCRLGGDEFIAFAERSANPREAADAARQVLQNVKDTCFEHFRMIISVSVGVSGCPEHGTTLDELYETADKALYRAKKNGKNQFMIYAPEQN